MWLAPGWNGGLRDYMPTTVSFSGFSGPAYYDNTSGVTVDQDGLAVMLEGALWWAGAPEFRFTSITIAADLSTLAGRGLPAATFRPDLAVGFKLQNVLAVGTNTDPGVSVSLVSAVPEPSTFMLLLGGLLAFFFKQFQRRRLVGARAGA